MEQNSKFRDEQAIGYLTALVAQAMSDSLRRGFEARGIELPYAQFLLLAQLFVTDGLTQQELANNLCKDKASVKRTVDNLIERGLVVKDSNRGGVKNIPLYVTEKARQIEQQILEISRENFSSITQGIAQQDIDTTRATLRTLYANVIAQVK